jgi:hypothetical protein
MYHKRHLQAGIVVSGTEEGNKFYQSFVPDIFVYNEYHEGILQRVMDQQKALRKKDNHAPCFVCLDDCMYDKAQFKKKIVQQLFYNGRHYGIFCLISNQYAYDLSPALRSNIDYVCILKDNIRANRERLWKSFGGIFPTFEQFNCVMDRATNNYGCLVIDQTSHSNDISDVAFWYRANPNLNFKMGGSMMWKYHQSRYDSNYDENEANTKKETPKHKVSLQSKRSSTKNRKSN